MTDTLLSAMAAPDEDVSPPSRVNPTSRASQIAGLSVGESACFTSGAVDDEVSLAQVLASIPELTASLRNNVMSSVRQATARTGGVYTVEVTDVTTPQRKLYVVAIVTRIE